MDHAKQSTTPSRHIWRTVSVFILAAFLVYLMALVQVHLDNRLLRYYYGVYDKPSYEKFHSTIKIMAKKNHDFHTEFPAFLLDKKFGGFGFNLLEELEANSSTVVLHQPRSLKLCDIVTSNTPLDYQYLHIIADMLACCALVGTAAYLLFMPYFDVFKTKFAERIRKMKTNLKYSLSTGVRKLSSKCRTPLPEPTAGPCPGGSSFQGSNCRLDNYHSLFFFRARYVHGLVFIRRLFMIVGLNYGMRAMTLPLTILPPFNLMCVPKLRTTISEILIGALNMMAQTEICCHDFLYSGHTSLLTVCCWFWGVYASHVLFHPNVLIDVDDSKNENIPPSGDENGGERWLSRGRYLVASYIPFWSKSTASANGDSQTLSSPSPNERQRLFKKKSTFVNFILYLLRILCGGSVLAMMVSLTLARLHYSADVLLGFLIGSSAFWLWHTSITIFYYVKFKSHILETDRYYHPLSILPIDQIALEERKLVHANREVRDVLVPIKEENLVMKFVGWVDGYDIYVKDNIGYCHPFHS